MLQWMGGSKHKVASSRKSVHKRQKHYFEQRKRQRQDPAHENHFSAQKHSHDNEERRSLDILSLTNLENSISSRLIHEHDVAQIDPHFSQLSPEKVSMKATSKFSRVTEEILSGLEPGPKSPIKISADTIYQNLPSINKNRTDSCRINVQPSPHSRTSNNAEQPSKTEDLQTDVSVLNLLGDDGPNIVLDEGQPPEAHVAFSVEGLGKVEFGTPAHSPRQHVSRNFPSPPNVQREIRSSKKFNYSQDYFGDKKDITDIYYDEFSTEQHTMFTFSCTSPGACGTKNQPFSCKEDIFQVGHNGDNLSNAASFGIINENLGNERRGAKRRNNSSHVDSYISSGTKRTQDISPDFHLRATFPPSSRFSFKEGKRSAESVMTSQYFRDLTSENEWSPDSYYQKRHHQYDKMTSPDSLFSPPQRFSSPLKDYQDSEESSSFDSVIESNSYAIGSKARKYNDSKIKHNYKNQMRSTTNYDAEIFSEGEFGKEIDEFFHEQNRATRNIENLDTKWNRGSEYSKSNSMFDGLGHKSMPEDDIFDSFQVDSKRISASMDFETGMSKVFPEADVHLPDKFQWDAKKTCLQSPFDDDFDIEFPYSSKTKGFPTDIEDEYGKIPENPKKVDSIEKNSLSSNGRTSCIADSKKKSKSNVESKGESQELTDTNQTRCSSVEVKNSPKGIPSQVPCTAENINLDSKRGTVPSQVATKDPLHENGESGRENQGKSASYQVMLQLLYVQNVLLQASQGKKRRSF